MRKEEYTNMDGEAAKRSMTRGPSIIASTTARFDPSNIIITKYCTS